MGVVFGALFPDAHHIADGARIAATIFTASTALLIPIGGLSGGTARALALMRAKSNDRGSPREMEFFRSDSPRIEDGC